MSRQVNSGDPSSGFPSKEVFGQNGSICDADLTVFGVKDSSKKLIFDVSAETTGKTITIAAGANSNNITITLPSSSGTLTTASPGGSDTQVQYNNAGAFGGDSGFRYSSVNKSVSVGTSNATGANSIAVGDLCAASNDRSSAFGNNTTASGANSHAEGYFTIASGNHSHAEGESNTASEEAAHAEGINCQATGSGSHAEGNSTTATGAFSHAQNNGTTTQGSSSHAAGVGSYAQGYGQSVVGFYNVKQGDTAAVVSGDSSFIVGNGANDGARHNAFAVLNTGEARYYGSTSGYVGVVAPAAPTNHTIQLPSAQGTGALSNNGSGVLSYVQTLVFTSSAGAGGAASAALTVTGLLSTDTVLAVTQKTPGANNLALIGYSTLVNNGITAIWAADPGAGAVITVCVKR